MSCSMKTTVIFCVSQSSRTLSIMRQRSSGPMPAVGSSSSSTFGSSTSASAISSSFWSPCDSVAAVRLRLLGKPSSSIACSARSRVSAAESAGAARADAALVGADRGEHGLLDRERGKDAGDLEGAADAVTHDLAAASGRRDRRRRAGRGRHPASSAPVIRLKNVLLPAPFGPITAVSEPSAKSSETSSVAFTPPKDFARLRISSIAAPLACITPRARTIRRRNPSGLCAGPCAKNRITMPSTMP